MNYTQIILNMYNNNISIKKISETLNITTEEVRQYLKKNNITLNIEKSPRDEKVCNLYSDGIKITEIAKIIGIDRRTVTSILKKYDDINYVNVRVKIDSITNKERNDKIIELYNEGKNMKEIAKMLNICTGTVKNVLDYFNIEIRLHPLGQGKGVPKKNRKHFFDINIFKAIDTEAKAYWLGFLYADGSISPNGTLELKLSEQDICHLEKFKAFVKGYDLKIEYIQAAKAYRLRLNSIIICDDLIKVGCMINKTFLLKFPTEEQVPKHLQHHFMRGYFDGDGCMHINTEKQKYHFTIIGTPDFLNGYEKILLNIINKNKPTKRIHQSTWSNFTESFSYGGRKQCLKIYDFLYKDATVFLDRKYEKYEMLMPLQDKIDNNPVMISEELSEDHVKS